MEAWLKFRAPGITMPLGLGIGRLVFNALNKVEWILAIVIAVNLFTAKSFEFQQSTFLWGAAVIILLLQSFWLLPALDARAELHIQGQQVPSSSLHIYFVAMELVKVLCLILFGINLFKI